jgi:hypothetical protein
MRKTTLFLMIAAALMVGEAPAADLLTTPARAEFQTETAIFKKKRKGAPRKKKGFLWGLFRKNDCGCPRH